MVKIKAMVEAINLITEVIKAMVEAIKNQPVVTVIMTRVPNVPTHMEIIAKVHMDVSGIIITNKEETATGMMRGADLTVIMTILIIIAAVMMNMNTGSGDIVVTGLINSL